MASPSAHLREFFACDNEFNYFILFLQHSALALVPRSGSMRLGKMGHHIHTYSPLPNLLVAGGLPVYFLATSHHSREECCLVATQITGAASWSDCQLVISTSVC